MAELQAYCGAPPVPATLLARWNLDPVLLAALVIALALAWRRAWSPRLLAAGWSVAALALVSPLCALSVSLFAARVGQHMLLTTVAAPLVALGLPAPAGRWSASPSGGALAYAAMLALWHAPVAYALTFGPHWLYWAMHLSSFAAALWLWRAALHAPAARLGAASAATLAAGLAMALTGAAIAFAARPLYSAHWLTTRAWGLSPLADQQLGGAILWLPAGIIVAAALLAPLARLLGDAPRQVAA